MRTTDNSGITTYGLTALEREMSTPPILQWSMAQFTFTFLSLAGICNSFVVNLVQKSSRFPTAAAKKITAKFYETIVLIKRGWIRSVGVM